MEKLENNVESESTELEEQIQEERNTVDAETKDSARTEDQYEEDGDQLGVPDLPEDTMEDLEPEPETQAGNTE